MRGGWNPIFSLKEAEAYRSILSALEQGILQAKSPSLGACLGKTWVLFQKAWPSPGPEALAALEMAMDESSALAAQEPGLRPLADGVSALLTTDLLFQLLDEKPEPHPDVDAMLMEELGEQSSLEAPDAILKWVMFGRLLIAQGPERRAGIEAYAKAIQSILARSFTHDASSHRLILPVRFAYPLDPVAGLSGLLLVAHAAADLLEAPNPYLAPLMDEVMRRGSFEIQEKMGFKFGQAWVGADDTAFLAGKEQRQYLRMAVLGHLGIWTALKGLQAQSPGLFSTEQTRQIDDQLDLLSKYSYYIHKKIGYGESGTLSASLLHGAAGALHCFNKLFQMTGNPDHQINARLWGRRLVDLANLDPKAVAIRSPRSEAGSLSFPEDLSLCHGAGGAWLALQFAVDGTAPAFWDSLLLSPLHPARGAYA